MFSIFYLLALLFFAPQPGPTPAPPTTAVVQPAPAPAAPTRPAAPSATAPAPPAPEPEPTCGPGEVYDPTIPVCVAVQLPDEATGGDRDPGL